MFYFKNVKNYGLFLIEYPFIYFMKRSTMNKAIRDAQTCFLKYQWCLPPEPKWDVIDFILGHFDKFGLVPINLAEEAEYCDKLMYAKKGMTTPYHTHKKKKEDIFTLESGQRITLEPEIYHEFYPVSDECVIGKVSTANENLYDNFFLAPDICRFSKLIDGEPAIVKLIGDRNE